MEGDLQTVTSLRICRSKALRAVHTLQLNPAQLVWCGVVWCGIGHEELTSAIHQLCLGTRVTRCQELDDAAQVFRRSTQFIGGCLLHPWQVSAAARGNSLGASGELPVVLPSGWREVTSRCLLLLFTGLIGVKCGTEKAHNHGKQMSLQFITVVTCSK